jgi:hypothetical protein
MLRVTQSSGFGSQRPPTLLPTFEFFYSASSAATRQEITSGSTPAGIGDSVGTLINAGTLGGRSESSDNADRGTIAQLQRRAVLSSASVDYTQSITSTNVSVLYTIAAIRTPANPFFYERIVSVGRAGVNDYNEADTACLILRDNLTNNFGVYRNNEQRASVAISANTDAVIETICRSSEEIACLDGGSDTTTTHSALGDLTITRVRVMQEGFQNSGSNWGGHVYAVAMLFREPTAAERARARAEMNVLMGRGT